MKFTYCWKVSKNGVKHISRECLPVEKFKERLNENRKMSKGGPLETPCWIWTGCRNKRGYGTVMFQGKAIRVHRLAYKLYIGDFPSSMEVCHRCDNTSCFNPKHLFLGTHLDNMRDAERKGRMRHVKGESHPMRKLCDKDVLQIRSMYSTGKFLQREIAEMFRIAKGNVSFIIGRQTWRHI